ncbi:MAG: hypothetical protein ACPF9D_01845, partial [Owenweeksia sp.]
ELVYEHGLYSQHLKKWFENYDRQKVKVYLFEDMIKDPSSFMVKVADELGIDSSFYRQYGFPKRNESVAIKSGFLHRMGLKFQHLIPFGLQKSLLPVYLKINSGSIPRITEEDRKVVQQWKESYTSSVNELKEMCPELNLELWK